ncbi:hypothetical protein KEM48_006292 [Puccinia striiformis f. sp. tritici PST-130]|nr:hypothetical protein KEM48_006292 [Puccinia striiformis f. sp. tritici PST-130]
MVSFNCAQFISIVVCTCAYMNIQAHHVTRSPDESFVANTQMFPAWPLPVRTQLLERHQALSPPTSIQVNLKPVLAACWRCQDPEMSEASKAKFMEGIKAKAGAGGVPGAGPLTAPTGVNVNPDQLLKRPRNQASGNPSPAPASGKVPGGKPLTTDLIQPQNTPVPNGGMPKNGESVNQEVTQTTLQIKLKP